MVLNFAVLALGYPLMPQCMNWFESRLLPEDVVRRLRYFPRAERAAAFAWDNIHRPVRLEEVAAEVGMNACAFSRYFTAKIGLPFSALVRSMRMERALLQLEAQDRAIGDLAEENGYQSGCTFARAFKNVVGTTPSEYRRRLLFGELEQEA